MTDRFPASISLCQVGRRQVTLLTGQIRSCMITERMPDITRSCIAIVPAMVLAGLALALMVSVNAAEPAPELVATWRFSALHELPDDAGKELVLRACIQCHDLGGLAAYRGYWARAQWQAMVDSMVKNGAVLSQVEADAVAIYLTRYYGRDSVR